MDHEEKIIKKERNIDQSNLFIYFRRFWSRQQNHKNPEKNNTVDHSDSYNIEFHMLILFRLVEK
jgi:hypothetical protein